MRQLIPAFALIAVLLVGALAVGSVDPASASPQPTPVCLICGPAFEGASSDQGVDASVERSTAVLEVSENGTATWTIENELSDGDEQFRDDPALLERIAEGRTGLVPGDSELVTAEMNDDVAVLSYEKEDAAERRAGMLVYDGLEHSGWEWYHLNVDELVVRGPDGTVVTNEPEGGAVDGPAVTWRGDGAVDGTGPSAYGQAPSFDERPVVVFGPGDADGGAISSFRTAAAVGLGSLAAVFSAPRGFLVVQPLAFAVVLAGPVLLLRRWRPQPTIEPLAVLLVTLGVLGTATSVYVGGRLLFVPSLLAFLTGLVGLAPRTRTSLDTLHGQVLAGAGLLVAAFVLQAAVYASPAGSLVSNQRIYSPIWTALEGTALVVALVALLPLGAAVLTDRWRLVGWWAFATVAFCSVPFVGVTATESAIGMTGFAEVVVALVAVALPLAGSPMLALGYALARPQSTDD